VAVMFVTTIAALVDLAGAQQVSTTSQQLDLPDAPSATYESLGVVGSREN